MTRASWNMSLWTVNISVNVVLTEIYVIKWLRVTQWDDLTQIIYNCIMFKFLHCFWKYMPLLTSEINIPPCSLYSKFRNWSILYVRYCASCCVLIWHNCRVWICNKVAKSFALRAAKTYASAFALRQRMLNCVQNLEYYMMVEVIEPNWVTFLASINKVTLHSFCVHCGSH